MSDRKKVTAKKSGVQSPQKVPTQVRKKKAKQPRRPRADRQDDELEDNSGEVESPPVCRQRRVGEPIYFKSAEFVRRAMLLPKGKHRKIALAIGKGRLTTKKAVTVLGSNRQALFDLLRAVHGKRYREPSTLPPKPISRFATKEFAKKVQALPRGLAKEIGKLAARGTHVDEIARQRQRPASEILRILNAIQDGEPILFLESRVDSLPTILADEDEADKVFTPYSEPSVLAYAEVSSSW
ncbi:MAG: hypothetical protein Q7S48_03865 [bacterium]|nr:hypothetical protein [bacterium]